MKGQIQNRKEVILVSGYRKKFKTAFHNENVDLRDYEKEIVDTIEKIAPGKHPKVFKDYYSTDDLTQSEAVKIGRELASFDDLKKLGRTITTFRLFEGKLYSSEDSNVPVKKYVVKNKKQNEKIEGGHA